MNAPQHDPIRAGYEHSWSTHGHKHVSMFELGIGRLAAANAIIDGGNRLLDVGCGDGALGALVRDRFNEVHGVDVSEVALARAASQGVRTMRADIDREPLPYGAASFDYVSCLDVIEHVYDPIALLRECHRVTAPGGRLLLTTVNMRYLKFLWQLAVCGRFPRTSGDRTLFDGGHLHYFARKNLNDLLADQGFHVIQQRGIIGTRRLKFLIPRTEQPLIREFLSTGIVIVAERRR